jgi:hypothetical protein
VTTANAALITTVGAAQRDIQHPADGLAADAVRLFREQSEILSPTTSRATAAP